MDKILNKEKITDFIKKTLDQENLELECIFDEKIMNKDIFLRLLNKFKEFNDFKNEENTLDIRCIEKGKSANIRISINGLEEIKQYCKTDSFDEIENPIFIKKELYKEQLDKARRSSRGARKVTILTARRIGAPITSFFKSIGLDVYVVPVGSSDPKVKADWIEKQIAKGYDTVYFMDDSPKNIKAVNNMLNRYPNVQSITKLIK